MNRRGRLQRPAAADASRRIAGPALLLRRSQKLWILRLIPFRERGYSLKREWQTPQNLNYKTGILLPE